MSRDHRFSLTVKIDGAPLAAEAMGLVEELVVDDRLQLPATVTLRFNDLRGDALTKSMARIGSKIEVTASGVGKPERKKIFDGDVTAFEGDYTESGRQVVLRGYDVSHKLQRGRRTRTFLDTTDSAIAQKIAGEYGIPIGTVDSTSVTYKHVSQAAVSDWDFLTARARTAGYELAIVDGKFNFRKPTPASGAPGPGTLRSENPLQLVYNQDLLEFRPRLTAGAQVKKVTVRGWDVHNKKELVGQASGATKTAEPAGGSPAAVAGKVNSTEPFAEVTVPLDVASRADQIAAALAEQIGSAFFEADGVSTGDPALKAGSAVSISDKNGVASQFAGKYVLSAVRHVFDMTGHDLPYKTHFEISGRQERTLLGLASAGNGTRHAAQSGTSIYGVVVGLVTDNKDPDNLGRVKVKFPWLADQYASNWTRVVQLGAGPDSGAFFLPEVNDEVLVGFEHGDVERPFVIGGLYNGKDKPDMGTDKGGGIDGIVAGNGKVKRRGITSRKGHRLVFVDEGDKPINSGIVIKTSDGKLRIELKEDAQGGASLHVYGEPKVIIEAKETLELTAGKDINIKAAKGNLKLEAAMNAEMKANQAFKIEGGTQVNVKATATAEFAGLSTTIKGQTAVQVQAPMVKVG